MSTAENALTAHLVVPESTSHFEISKVKDEFRHELEHLGIQHATLETEVEECKVIGDQVNGDRCRS